MCLSVALDRDPDARSGRAQQLERKLGLGACGVRKHADDGGVRNQDLGDRLFAASPRRHRTHSRIGPHVPPLIGGLGTD
jgi:hypothetical protein